MHVKHPLRAAPAVRQVVAYRYRPRDATVRRALATADALAVGAAMVGVFGFHARDVEAVGRVLVTLPVWLLVFKAYRLYERDIRRIGNVSSNDVPAVLHSLLVGSVLLWAYWQAVMSGALGTLWLLQFATLAAGAMLVLRAATRRVLTRVLGPERALLIGDAPAMPLLARKLRMHPEYGVEAVGVLSNSGAEVIGGLSVLGACNVDELASVTASARVDRIVIAHADAESDTTPNLVRQSHALGLKVNVLPHLFDVLGPSAEVDDVEGVTVLGLYPPVLPRSSRALKRLMDVVGALVLLVASAPLLVVVAVAVKATSPGPVLFCQHRVGRGGRSFKLNKFRTMVVGAEAMTAELLVRSEDPNWLLLADDPRITRVGRLLRTTSLDELPQLWNVLRGEMSLVGPRPLVETEDRRITGWARGRLDLTPGLTGLWQVLGRTSIPFEEMIKLDYIYVTDWSLWRDIQILLRTVPVLMTRRGAN